MIITIDCEYTSPTEAHLSGNYKRCVIRLLGIPIITFNAQQKGRLLKKLE